jgi:hypothetical protein
MLLYRSLALGFMGACLMLLARRPECAIRFAPAPVVVHAPAPPSAAIVDVAPGIAAAQLGPLVRLAPGEHVVAVGEHAVSGDLEAGAVLAAMEARSGSYVDLTVAGAIGSRRVLVLLH